MATGKTAIVFGASGLVGSMLVKELLINPAYSQVLIVTRKPLVIINPKIQEITLGNYKSYNFSETNISDVHVFCCLGTTIKKAGTKDEFKKVDYELPLEVGNWAISKDIQTFVVISSIGANPDTKNFYLKTKGELEEALKLLGFDHLYILRPSLLLGERNEFRLGEEIAKMFSGVLNLTLRGSFKKYKPISAVKVAKAMVFLANSDNKDIIFESDKLEMLSTH